MKFSQFSFPKSFKGIALFTPGGDLIYCIDPSKQSRWHLHLCVALQEILGLSEPPHFLVPCYTATLDRWLDSHTQEIQYVAEIYPPVLRYQNLLNAVFQVEDLVWQIRSEDVCNSMVVATYYEQFPELWENHDLVFQLPSQESPSIRESSLSSFRLAMRPENPPLWETDDHRSSELDNSPSSFHLPETHGYVLRLYVSGNSASTERTLQTLHKLLEESLGHPYTLKVVDVFRHPEQAELDQISATPTLIKIWPKPVRRIVGELDDLDKILRLLDVGEG